MRPKPFSTLIAASSIITAVLFVAGFSYRWSFYYNFGVPQIVYGLSFQSFLIAAIEMIREPENLLHSIAVLASVIIGLEFLFIFIQKSLAQLTIYLPKRWTYIFSLPSIDSALAADCARGAILLMSVFALASSIGYSHFLTALEDAPTNTQPLVTALLSQVNGLQATGIGCGSSFIDKTAVIGDLKGLREQLETNRTCSLESTGRWRLLYRDADVTYLYESLDLAKITGIRPLTIVLPSSSIQGIFLQ